MCIYIYRDLNILVMYISGNYSGSVDSFLGEIG